jgi:NAD kinase
MAVFDKVVIITRKTTLEELTQRYNTRAQAKFLLESRGESFADVEAADATYRVALGRVKSALPRGVRVQEIERGFLPTFLFGPNDLAVTLGPDGLVVNAAKYLREQPLLAFNADPARMDGVLIPFAAEQADRWLPVALDGHLARRLVTMAVARFDDGQALYAVNDLFVGQRSHVSARYRLRYRSKEEVQSSSGIIVSTGAGSTGWLRSILAGAAGVSAKLGGGDKFRERYRFDAEAEALRFSVREPFESRISQAGIVFGDIRSGEVLEVASQMPQNGVIFSDGVEADFLGFDSGRIARIGVADRKLHLLQPAGK